MPPLRGLLVLDFSTLLPGPMATLMLAEAGAEVIKIERPGTGDEMRSYQPRWGGESVNFALLNRGKKSVTVDLKDTRSRPKLEPLLARADIVVEQFRPGVMARLGLGYDDIAGLNPRIIYCSITGYGATGPKRDTAAHDLNYIAEAGLLGLSTGPLGAPVVPPALIADIAGGSYPAVINILLAIQERERTGRGRHLDVSMADNVFPFMYWAIGKGLAAGAWPANGADLVTGGTPRYRLYPTQDGRLVAAAPIEQKFWERFCELIELPEALRDDRRDREATISAAALRIAARPSAEWRETFAGEDCCCNIVQSVEEALADAHFRERGLFAHRLIAADGSMIPALPVAVDPSFRPAPDQARSAPALGAHTADLLG